ncbi:uncharacterized protein NEPG_02642, partial [Nematocida parisii ERTm1]|uniref:uncharacterized protein n=1 Tax=Nematocida parisii (strain ERTm1 / ATCC PRA-289) TaxID=881290 RepID=UPI000264B9BE
LKDEVQPQSMNILAALFLLSEQVDIPIAIEEKKREKKLVLKSTDGITTYINQSLRIFTKDQTKSKTDWKRWCKNIKSLIEFLKKYIDNKGVNPSTMEGLPTEPTTYEQFMTGEFLNTSQFLIQSYIYEFIDTKEKYIEFVNAVYTLLNDQIKNEKSYKRVLSKCFVKEGARQSKINHTKIICDLMDTIDKYKIFPFMDSSQLPSYTQVKAYDREKDEFINDETRKYSNCVEAALLGLVCCLVYDPNKKKYNTDHLPDNKETKPLKDFFKKYTEPRETTDYEMHEDWCRVIADLKNDKILYLKEKTNELDSSLLNILYVVSDITGSKEEVVKEIKYLEELLADKNINDKLDIEESLTTIFKELSNNKNLEIECDEFTVGTRKDNNLDLFGEFKLIYTFNEKKNGILVEITPGHCTIRLLEDLLSSEEKNIIKEKLTEIQNTYSNIESYTAYTIRQYINIELAKMEKEYALGRIQESIRNNHDNINDIFLHGMILSVDQKVNIVKYFLAVHVNNTLPKNNSLVRFTNNLIGSTPLDDSATRRRMLLYCFLNKDSKNYYPRIERCWEEVTTITRYNFYTIINSILRNSGYSIDVKLECFKRLMMVLANHNNKHAIITSLYLINDIVDCSRKTNELTK